jgi:hypothetical protein
MEEHLSLQELWPPLLKREREREKERKEENFRIG